MPESGASKAARGEKRSDSMMPSKSASVQAAHHQFVLKIRAVVYILLAVSLCAFGVTLASNVIQGIPQMFVVAATSLIFALVLMVVLCFIKRDKLHTAAYFLLILAITYLLVMHITLAGLLTFIILTGVALILVLGNLVFRGRWGFLLLISFIFVNGVVAIDLIPAFSRFNITSMPLADPVMTGVTVILLIILIALSIRFAQFSTIRTRLLVSFTVTTIIPGILTVGVILVDNALGGKFINTAMSAAWLSMVATTISIFLALTGAHIFSQGISRPLKDMVAMAADVGDGDLSKKVVVNRIDEIGQTALAFNGMTNQLRSVIGELEERVISRTADLEQRTIQLEVASRISRQIASVQDVDAMIKTAVEQIYQQLDFDAVAMFRIDDQWRTLRLAGYAPDEGAIPLDIVYGLESENKLLFVAALKQKNALIVGDYDSDEQYDRLPEFPHILSELALPLRVRDEVIGVLDITSRQRESFTSRDATYLQILADQIALAIDNAALLASAEDRLQEIERLVTTQSIEGWHKLVSQKPNWSFTYDGSRVLPTKGESGLGDVDLVIPLESDRSELGTFSFVLPENHDLNSSDVELARAIAREAGQAIESARLYTETQDTLQEVGALYRATQAVVSANTPEQVLTGFVSNLVPPGIDQCMLLAKLDTVATDGGEWARVEAAWEDGNGSTALTGQVWDMRQIPAFNSEVLVVSDIESSIEMDDISTSTLREKGHRALMAVPLGIEDAALGGLLINTLHSPYVFTSRQVRLYSNFADQLTQALVNIRLVQETRNRVLEEQYVRVAAERMREPVDMQEVLDVAADEMRRILNLEDVAIRLTRPGLEHSSIRGE